MLHSKADSATSKNTSSSLPQYRRIYNYLYEEIASGKLKAGDRVPSERELCDTFKVSRITSKKALELLSEQGFIFRSPGTGSFVSDNIPLTGRKNGKSREIGFLTPDFSDSFGAQLIYGIEETCRPLGYHLILKRTKNSVEEEDEALNSLSCTAGFLVMPVHGEFYNPEILKHILTKKPLVFIDRKMQGLAAPSVSTDNIAAAEMGVEYLLRLGHRNIAFYSGPVEHISTVADRRTGFVKALTNYGIPYNEDYFCQNFAGTGSYPFYTREQVITDQTMVISHLSAHPEITAAFTTTYNITLVVNNALRDMGRLVPEDFSILAFDVPESFARTPFFTYLDQDEYTIGKLAVESLHNIITDPENTSLGDIQIPAKLIIGKSIAQI
jgi:DNA-binding LacI/PurR family transcriptional regulator